MTIVALIALAKMASAIEVTTTPGQLSNQLDDTSVTTLTITGEMDARDFLFIANELPSLTSLDLSGVSIVAYSDPHHPLIGTAYDYAAGTLPQSMLMGMKLESIVLPDSLLTIGKAALAGCDHLTAITFPETLTTIGDYAFSGTGLEAVTIPATVTSIGRGAFAHCFSLASATIEATDIGDFAFLGDHQLQSVLLGTAVKRIGTEAFHDTGILSLDASAATALDSVGGWALASTPVTSISLPTSVTELGEGAFFGTTQLTSASLPSTLEVIPAYAFAGGSQVLGDTLLHEGLTTIGDYAFYNWDNTRYFFIPSTVTYIGTRAMAGMTGLERIDVEAATPPALGDSVWAGVDQPAVKLGVPSNDAADLYNSAEQWQEFYILRYYLLGDVNDDGIVDVTDVNLTISYMLGKNPEVFIFPAGDIDGNNTIDVTDVNGIINIILGKVGQTTIQRVKRRDHRTLLTTDDMLSIEPFSVKVGETRTLDIYLHNGQNYSAMQFDITLPDGIEMVSGSVTSTTRSAHHSQMMRTSETTSRVLSYSMNDMDFANNDDALVRLRVRVNDEVASGACILLSNVVLSHDNKSYHASESSIPIDNTTGVDNLTLDTSRVYATGSTLVIESAEATTVQVVSLNGIVRLLNVPQGRSEWNELSGGVYVVRLLGKSYKVSLQ